MRRLLCLCLLLAATCPIQAQQKPNTLTPKEIADGWILLFDGETTFGWTSVEDSKWKIENGMLVARPDKFGILIGTTDFLDCELAVECSMKKGGTVKLLAACDNNLRLADVKAHVGSRGGLTGLPWVKDDGVEIHELWTWCNLNVKAGYVRTCAVKNERVQTKYGWDLPESESRSGKVAVGGNGLLIRTIKLKPTNTTFLFNGTDLAGWKEFPGKKSTFTVIDNAINVKNGPGDLQTVGKYKDFILQLECKSNGKHLNSGIFFRCRDNEYQNGYEAQIHNGFTETPKKYLIEEFDPKTNTSLGKKEQLFNAIDYGTGAIYRRTPARKQMAKDGEWFGMTIVAHGNHFATWVNGVQVVDWTDHREKKDNARNGCRLEAGHISIQGHDPTTDLSFKNIRIAEFK